MALEISRCSSTGFRCWAVAVVAGIVVVRGGRPVDTGNARRVASGRRRKIGGQVGKRDGAVTRGGKGGSEKGVPPVLALEAPPPTTRDPRPLSPGAWAELPVRGRSEADMLPDVSRPMSTA